MASTLRRRSLPGSSKYGDRHRPSVHRDDGNFRRGLGRRRALLPTATEHHQACNGEVRSEQISASKTSEMRLGLHAEKRHVAHVSDGVITLLVPNRNPVSSREFVDDPVTAKSTDSAILLSPKRSCRRVVHAVIVDMGHSRVNPQCEAHSALPVFQCIGHRTRYSASVQVRTRCRLDVAPRWRQDYLLTLKSPC
jgi:hypothetical protein